MFGPTEATRMDVSSLPTKLQIQGAVLSKAKDQQEANGRAAVALIDSVASAAPRKPPEAHVGRNVNVRA